MCGVLFGLLYLLLGSGTRGQNPFALLFDKVNKVN